MSREWRPQWGKAWVAGLVAAFPMVDDSGQWGKGKEVVLALETVAPSLLVGSVAKWVAMLEPMLETAWSAEVFPMVDAGWQWVTAMAPV